MKGRKHSLEEVLGTLYKRHDIKIDNHRKVIQVLTGNLIPKQNDLGNKSWGKIDFLRNHCGFTLIKVDRFE